MARLTPTGRAARSLLMAAVALAAAGVAVAGSHPRLGRCDELRLQLAVVEAQVRPGPAQRWEDIYALQDLVSARGRIYERAVAAGCLGFPDHRVHLEP
jgi:hypothetical protein